MKLGIVGSEAAKFTPRTKVLACVEISALLEQYAPDVVVSGHSPLGGIDIWAVKIAERLGIQTQEFPPRTQRWADGYKLRNLEIAEASDVVVCITLKELPEGFRGRRFDSCYHHRGDDPPPPQHVKSGGCWTARQAHRLGKPTELVVIP